MLAIDLRLALGDALTQLGEHGRRLALLGEAEALARALDDRARLGRVLASMALVLRITGDLDGAMAASRQALDLAVTLGDRALQAQASHTLGQAYYAIGDFGRAAELLRRNVEAADRAVWHAQYRLAAPIPGVAGADLGRARGLRRGPAPRGGGTPPRHAGRPRSHTDRCPRLPRPPVPRPGGPGARHPGVRPGPGPLVVPPATGTCCQRSSAGLGYAYALQGRLAEGRALLEEAISESISTGARRAVHWAWLSEGCRLAGHGEEAWQHARQALDLARQQKDRGDEALALHQLGVVHAHADPPDVVQAEAYYQQALALAEELGMRPLQAHCHLGLGRLYGQTGRGAQARAALATAIALYRDMEMTFWLPQAEAALAQVESAP